MNITKDLNFQQAIEKSNLLLNRKRTVINLFVDSIEKMVRISHLVNGCEYIKELYFNECDEWMSFETDCVYDIHFLYEDGILDVSIYQVIDDVADFEIPIKTKITLQKVKLAKK